jgi:hypothetical protein
MNTIRLVAGPPAITAGPPATQEETAQPPSPLQFIRNINQPPRPLYFAASDHPSIHLLLSGALSNLPPLLKKSTGLIPSGYVCTGARYGAAEGDDFDGGAAKSNQLTAIQF